LRAEYRFTEWDLMSFASGCRVAWLRKKVFAQEAQVLGRRAFEAVNGWVLGRRGKPRFKSRLRGLHSLECKDLASSMVIRETADGRVGLRWGVGMVLRFRLDARDPYQWWAAWHVAEGRMLRCRIVRTMINGKWAYRSQLVLAGHPLQRYATGHELVGVDVGPSTIAAVGDTGVFKETFCAELADHDRQIRRLSDAWTASTAPAHQAALTSRDGTATAGVAGRGGPGVHSTSRSGWPTPSDSWPRRAVASTATWPTGSSAKAP
jgi:hypothetical protein